MNNKKNKILVATTISLLSLASVSLGLSLKDNDNHYEKVSADSLIVDGDDYTAITYANFSSALHVGDKVYFANNTNSGIGGDTQGTHGYKVTTALELSPFIVIDIKGYDVAFKYTVNNKYIKLAKSQMLDFQTSMTYLTLDSDSYFVYQTDKTYYFGIYGSCGLYTGTTPGNRFTCYKINNSTNSKGDFADAMLNDLTCDDGVNAPSTTMWSNLEDIFDKLSAADKSELKTMDGDESGADVEQAIAKYDYIIKKYYKTGNYDDFIGRIDSKKVTPDSVNNIFSNINNNDNGSTEYIVIAITATLSLLSIASFFFLKKRRA